MSHRGASHLLHTEVRYFPPAALNDLTSVLENITRLRALESSVDVKSRHQASFPGEADRGDYMKSIISHVAIKHVNDFGGGGVIPVPCCPPDVTTTGLWSTFTFSTLETDNQQILQVYMMSLHFQGARKVWFRSGKSRNQNYLV